MRRAASVIITATVGTIIRALRRCLSPVRVLHVVRPAAGGIRQHVINLIRFADRAQTIPSIAAPPEFLSSLPADLVLESTASLDIAARFHLRRDLAAARQLLKYATYHSGSPRIGGRGGFGSERTVLHAHGLRAAWVTALAGRRHAALFLFTAHNLVEKPSLPLRLGLRFAARRASQIIAVSQAVADSLAKYGVPEGKITVIPNGVDLDYFAERFPNARKTLDVTSDTFVVGCIARLSPEKGVDMLLQAAALCPNLTFLIAGDGPDRAALSQNLPHNARLLGRIDDPRLLLAAADIIAIPSRQEGQGIVALEAMATGVPLVASRVGGLAEMLRDDETALLVPPNDAPALASALRHLQQDAPLRDKLIANAKRLARERYDVRRMEGAVAQMYRLAGL